MVDECIDFVIAKVERIEKIKGEANMLPIANSLLMPNEKLKWTLTPIALKMLGDEYGSENLISNGIVNIIEL